MKKEKIIEVLQKTKDIHWNGFENEVSEALTSAIDVLRRINVDGLRIIISEITGIDAVRDKLSYALYEYLTGEIKPSIKEKQRGNK